MDQKTGPESAGKKHDWSISAGSISYPPGDPIPAPRRVIRQPSREPCSSPWQIIFQPLGKPFSSPIGCHVPISRRMICQLLGDSFSVRTRAIFPKPRRIIIRPSAEVAPKLSSQLDSKTSLGRIPTNCSCCLRYDFRGRSKFQRGLVWSN